jgi:hypothetical protein
MTGVHSRLPFQLPVKGTTFPWYAAISIAVEWMVDAKLLSSHGSQDITKVMGY